MMDIGSSDTYIVQITLVTDAGDLPNWREVEDMIAAQMSGPLDDPVECGGTGLFCAGVTVVGSECMSDGGE
jgi:hypothetical protein